MIPNGYNTIPSVTLLQALAGSAQIIRTIFYVDANAGLDTNDGLSWEYPMKTLTVAMLASHTDIAADSGGWAARNRIFYKGDNAEAAAETLTTLAQKTDIIGVGSYDHRDYPVLIGNHVIVGSYMGCAFYNMGFATPAAGGVGLTIPTTVSGLSLLKCKFDGRSTPAGTIGLLATGVEQLEVEDCDFIGKWSTATIDIGTGAGRAMRIVKNRIESGAIGIRINSGYTCVDAIATIDDNDFAVVTLVVDDNSSKTKGTRNRGYTAAAKEIATVLDCNELYWVDNQFGNATGTGIYPALAAIA
jgi:hypothetical protein